MAGKWCAPHSPPSAAGTALALTAASSEPRLAVLALGRLDGVSTLLPDRSLFLYTYVRKERCFLA